MFLEPFQLYFASNAEKLSVELKCYSSIFIVNASNYDGKLQNPKIQLVA